MFAHERAVVTPRNTSPSSATFSPLQLSGQCAHLGIPMNECLAIFGDRRDRLQHQRGIFFQPRALGVEPQRQSQPRSRSGLQFVFDNS